MAKTKRGYSTAFPGTAGSRYLLDGIPPKLWRQARTQAKKNGLSMRALLLTLLTDWSAQQHHQQNEVTR
jgi:hypothetical protein